MSRELDALSKFVNSKLIIEYNHSAECFITTYGTDGSYAILDLGWVLSNNNTDGSYINNKKSDHASIFDGLYRISSVISTSLYHLFKN